MRFFWCLFLLLPSACAGPGHSHERVDAVYDAKISYTDPIILENAHFDERRSAYLALVIEQVQPKNSNPRYDIKVYAGPRKGRQMIVPEEGVLSLWVNGKQINYTTSAGSPAGGAAPGIRGAQAAYVLYDDIQREDLEAMAAAAMVRVHVKGESDSLTGDFGPGNFRTLKEFLSHHGNSPQ